MNKGYGVIKMLLTALPLSNLHYTSIALYSFVHQLCFINGISYGLLTENILSCSAGIDQLQAVPVIGCCNNHNIHIFISQHLSVFVVYASINVQLTLFFFLCSHYVV